MGWGERDNSDLSPYYKKTAVIISKNLASKDMIAELWSGDHRLGEIYLDGDVPKLRIFPPIKNSWHFELDDFIDFLRQARQELMQKVLNSSETNI